MAPGIPVKMRNLGTKDKMPRTRDATAVPPVWGGRKVAVVAAARRASPLEDRNLLTWSRSMSA
jgi:hypothetical protein